MPSPARTSCWCGETGGPEIGPDYRRCSRCGTAVVSTLPAGPHGDPRRDDGFYGKRYWLEHQTERGLPDVRKRARADLSERCVFWLERVLEGFACIAAFDVPEHLVDPLDTVRRDEIDSLRSRLEPIEPTSAPEP